MFDVAPSEFLLFAIVALVVIGPKDLPKAMRVLGYWVGRARGVARQFRSGFDSMVREAELAEMEKKWADENARIMQEHGGSSGDETTSADQTGAVVSTGDANTIPVEHIPSSTSGVTSHAITVDKPVVAPAPAGTHSAADNKADS